MTLERKAIRSISRRFEMTAAPTDAYSVPRIIIIVVSRLDHCLEQRSPIIRRTIEV
jgi:hypothetical protein